MGLGTHNVLNVAAGKPVAAAKSCSVVDLKRNVLGGGIAKRIVTRTALRTGLIHNIVYVLLLFLCNSVYVCKVVNFDLTNIDF